MLSVAEAVLAGLEHPAELGRVLEVLQAAVLGRVSQGAGVGRVAVGGQNRVLVLRVRLRGAAVKYRGCKRIALR